MQTFVSGCIHSCDADDRNQPLEQHEQKKLSALKALNTIEIFFLLFFLVLHRTPLATQTNVYNFHGVTGCSIDNWKRAARSCERATLNVRRGRRRGRGRGTGDITFVQGGFAFIAELKVA